MMVQYEEMNAIFYSFFPSNECLSPLPLWSFMDQLSRNHNRVYSRLRFCLLLQYVCSKMSCDVTLFVSFKFI